MRKACGRAREVCVLAYGGRAVDLWWQGVARPARASGPAGRERGADRGEPGAGAAGGPVDAAARDDPGRARQRRRRRDLGRRRAARAEAGGDGALSRRAGRFAAHRDPGGDRRPAGGRRSTHGAGSRHPA